MELICFEHGATGAVKEILLPNHQTAKITLSQDVFGAKASIALSYRGAYGMGEKFNGCNQKGNTVVNAVEEKFCCQGEKTYCPAPFFFTDTGLGVFVETDEITTFAFGETIEIVFPQAARLALFTGTPESIVAEYMSISGAPAMLPKWAFGPWISANHWNTEEKVLAQLALLKQHRYPATVLVAEAWSDEATFYIFNGASYIPKKDGAALRYEDFSFEQSAYWHHPQNMIEALHKEGVHLVLWQIPVFKQQGEEEALSQQNEYDRADAVRRGLCVKNSDGTPYTIPEGHWFSGSMIPDFTNPDTVTTWFQKRQYLLDIGVDGFKTDGGEFIYKEDVSFFDGTTGKQGVNRYAQSYTESYTKFLGPQRVLFSRAGFTGQQKAPAHWGGDQQSTNDELKHVFCAGLSASLSGMLFWGFDIAGFAGPLPSLDLYRRATQLACFCPVMQWHSEPDGGQFRELMASADGNNERSPWNLAAVYNAPDFIEEMRYWHALRMNLLPYLYATALQCVAASAPMMRAMVYAYPEEPHLAQDETQFMLGDSLLIAPLLEENATKRSVLLPTGEWFSLFTKKRYAGMQSIESDSSFPVYLKSGSALALNLNEEKQLGSYVGNKVEEYTCLHFILAGNQGAHAFCDDLGNDFVLKWNGDNHTLTGTCATTISVEVWG